MDSSDFDTALAISIVQQKPDGMDLMDYVISVQTKIMKRENELFFREFLGEHESNQPSDQQPHEELSHSDLCVSPEENINADLETIEATDLNSSLLKKPAVSLVQPIITIKSLIEIVTNKSIDSIFNTINWKTDFEKTGKKPIEIMSRSIQEALDILAYTLVDNFKLLHVIKNWGESNLVKYFVDLMACKVDNSEFGFTCRDQVMSFVQNTSFKILDNHHLYSSLHVEYQCNLIAILCYTKYIRWSVINLLLNRLKTEIEVVPNHNSLRSIFYTFHLFEKLFQDTDFRATPVSSQNKINITGLWKNKHKKKSDNEIEVKEQKLKEWISLLEHISTEALKKNVFLVSIRANQCLESLKLIASKEYYLQF